MWKCIYTTADKYRKDNEGWIFVRHEDVAKNPIKEYRKIFNKAGLKMTNEAVRYIEKKSESGGKKNKYIEDAISRNSKKVIKNWKNRLGHEEIKKVKRETKDVWKNFYEKEEW